MKKIQPTLLLLFCALAGGCNTLGTLSSQINETPLPPRVAAKLYGVCRDCHRDGVVPGCERCIVVQQKRRMLAGTPARQITPELEAFVRNEDNTPRQAIWIREEDPVRKRQSTYNRLGDSVPGSSQKAPAFSPPANTTDVPTAAPYPSRTPRKPDGYDALGY